MTDIQIDMDTLMRKVHEQAIRIVELELVRDALLAQAGAGGVLVDESQPQGDDKADAEPRQLVSR